MHALRRWMNTLCHTMTGRGVTQMGLRKRNIKCLIACFPVKEYYFYKSIYALVAVRNIKVFDVDVVRLVRSWSFLALVFSINLLTSWWSVKNPGTHNTVLWHVNKKPVLSQRWQRNAPYMGALKIFSSSSSPSPALTLTAIVYLSWIWTLTSKAEWSPRR